MVTDDGKILKDTTTTSFPQTANHYGLTSSGGTITFSYTVMTEGYTTMDIVTGEVVTVPGTPEVRSFDRRVEFVRE